MPALNYKKQFAPKVKAGLKLCTIRAMRKRPFKKGDRLYHYTGMRTKSCEKLGESVATEVLDIEIKAMSIKINGKSLSFNEASALSVADGFKDLPELLEFFKNKGKIDFTGQLIKWEEMV